MNFDQAIEYLANVLGPVLGGVIAIWLVIEARAHMKQTNAEIEKRWRGGEDE